MQKAKFERVKPFVNVGSIGSIDHGRTLLSAAICAALSAESKKVQNSKKQPKRAAAQKGE